MSLPRSIGIGAGYAQAMLLEDNGCQEAFLIIQLVPEACTTQKIQKKDRKA